MILKASILSYRFFKLPKNQINKEAANLMRLLAPEKGILFLGIASAAISSSFLLYYPTLANDVEILRNLKYDLANSDLSNQIQSYYYYKWGGIAALTGLIGGSRRYFNQQVSNRVAMRMRNVMFHKMLINRESIPLHSQQLVHKLANDVSLVSNGLSMDILAFVRGFVFAVGGTGYLLYYAYPLLPLSILSMGIIAGSAIVTTKYMARAKVAETQALEKASQVAQERFTAYRLIKLSNKQEDEITKYSAQLSRWYKEASVFSRFQAMNMAFLESGGLLALIVILFKGCYLISMGQLDPNLLRQGVNALLMASGMRTMINIYSEIVKTSAIYRTITDFYPNLHNDPIYKSKEFVKNYKELIENDDKLIEWLKNPPKDCQSLYDHHTQAPPQVEFKNINYSYNNTQQILRNFNMKIGSGQIVALVGESGSGKTTILNLLTKLFTPQSGEILIDGQSLNHMDFDWVQRYVSYVQQDGIIFNGSVYENIIYGNQGFDQSLDGVIKAAKMARAHEFITNMPDSYLTQLKSDGTTSLSGGQKQRIVLARAILKNPKILILDEATSNIDQLAENEIIQALKEICKEKTVLIVTHKIENFRQIITNEISL